MHAARILVAIGWTAALLAGAGCPVGTFTAIRETGRIELAR